MPDDSNRAAVGGPAPYITYFAQRERPDFDNILSRGVTVPSIINVVTSPCYETNYAIVFFQSDFFFVDTGEMLKGHLDTPEA